MLMTTNFINLKKDPIRFGKNRLGTTKSKDSFTFKVELLFE